MSCADTIIIIPAHNEAPRIAAVVEGIRSRVDATVLVVDDFSSDDTGRIARDAGAKVVRHPVNFGYGTAVQTGIRYGLAHGYKTLAQMDGDGQHDADFLAAVVDPVQAGEADYVIGSRFLPREGGDTYDGAALRGLGSRVLAFVVRCFTRLRITDPTSGFVAMNAKVMERLATEAYPHDYPDADVIIMLHRLGLRVYEVAVRMTPNREKSMHSGLLRPLYYIYKMSLSVLMTVLRS